MLSEPTQRLILAALLICLTVIAYAPVRDCGYIWDDDDYVTENEELRTDQGLWRIWTKPGAVPQYYPVVHTTFWIEYRLWELNPQGYHLVNLALHIFVSLLWWAVLRKANVPGAWLAAAIFAVHPVHVESVAWITERKNVLSGVFYLLSALTYMKFCPVGQPNDPLRMRDWRLYGLALLLFTLALLSKSVTATLPCALLLLLWWQQKQLPVREFVVLIPFFLVGMVAGLHTAHMERTHVGADGDEWMFTLAERFVIAGRAIWFYAYKVIWPNHLLFFYERWHVLMSEWDRQWWTQLLFPGTALGVIGTLWAFRKRIGYGPVAAVLFFCGTLFPALGFLNVFPFRYSFVADHFQYLASMGIIALACSLMAISLKDRTAFGFVASIILIAFVVRTRAQIPVYQNETALWNDVIEKNPLPWMAHNNLGNLLLDKNKKDEAIEQFRLAYQAHPSYSVPYYNIGTVLAKLNRHGEAIKYYRMAIRNKPKWGKHNYNYAVSLIHTKQQDEAIEQLNIAIRKLPRHAPAYFNLGKVLFDRKQIEPARDQFEKAVALNPSDNEAWIALGVAYEKLNQYEQAQDIYVRLLSQLAGRKQQLSAVQVKLGLVLARLKRMDEAKEYLVQATINDASNASAFANLGAMRLQFGDFGGAVQSMRQAVEIEPNRTATLRSLAWTLATCPDEKVRDTAAALTYAKRALELQENPDRFLLDAFAAAEAGNGQFEKALEHAQRAAELAAKAGHKSLEQDIRKRIKLYRNEQHYIVGQQSTTDN